MQILARTRNHRLRLSATMTTVPEVTDLFLRLATHLKTLNQDDREEEGGEEEALNLSISRFNQSLNPSREGSGVRVLDAALSLMCFKAPQVFDSLLDRLVQTIVTVLSSSISCQVLRFHKEEVLQVGSSFSHQDCMEFMEACVDIVGKLEGNGMLAQMLSCAVVRVVIAASCYRYLLPSTLVLDGNSIDRRSTAGSRLLCHLPREVSLKNDEIPFRLLFWYLDPLTLKHDVLKILRDSMERPFICLNEEFHDRMEWCSIIICLVLSPAMFIETRALLHSWLLVTGLASLQEFLSKFVLVIVDVITRPTWWGIPVELGSKLPFSNAYFPYNRHLFRTLAGSLSSESLLQLASFVTDATKVFDLTSEPAALEIRTIDHKSSWALAINFPDWFYFASILLFSEGSFPDSFHTSLKLGTARIGETHDVEPLSYCAAAARYIAWILSPINRSHQDLLVDSLTKISESWMLKSSLAHDKESDNYSKKSKKPKLQVSKDYTPQKEDDLQIIGIWLKEFQDICMWFCSDTVNISGSREARSSCGIDFQQNELLRRIPLGILIGCLNIIDEGGCQMLLHYAATGKILQSIENKRAKSKHVTCSSLEWEESIRWTDKCNRREAIAGARLVFSLTDTAESMSNLLFETEEGGLQFIFRVKLRVCKYLINCIKRLIQLGLDKDGVLILKDLSGRLVRWKHQGQEVSPVDKDLEDVINSLSHKLSSLLTGDILKE